MDITKKTNETPDLHKGDYVGIKNSNNNAYVVSEPYLIDSEWFVTVNPNQDRLDSFWADTRKQHDMNIKAARLYVIERNTLTRTKEQVKDVFNKISKNAIKVVVIGVVLVAVIAWLGGNFNDMVRARNQVDNKFSAIDVKEQQRFDKITALFNATTGSQIQEQEVFKNIADGRKTYQSPTATEEEKQAASTQVSTNVLQIPRLLQEAYPQLNSNQNVQKLMGEIVGIEGEIATARNDYNNTATNYNTNIQSFPKLIFANMFGFKEKSLYKNDAAADKAPNTDASDKLRQQPATKPAQ